MTPPVPPAPAASPTGATGHRARRPEPVLAVGLARNCGGAIGAAVARVSAALAGFEHVQWLVIESDSSDDTVARLEALRREHPGFDFESLGELRRTKPLRTDRIAHCRNRYLERLAEDPRYRDVQLLVVADLDGVNDLLTPEGLLSCWDFEGWDVCTANQRAPYYDLWALRHPDWMQGDCWRQYEFLKAHGLPRERALQAAVHSRHLRIPEDAAPIEVESAFGGLGVYRRAAIGDSRYIGLAPDGGELCEHLTFHAALRAKGRRIFINPRMINVGWVEHTRHLQFWPTLKRNWWAPPKAWLMHRLRGARG
jgi:hypothetical protein